ncbi:glutathione transferase GstA [Legionella bononiensis]|uniref:Glutathione transferase GstA n=1 Tax=Legionella bononiensis TaxID=2793102 RepID=A0ABS1WEG9_9GAMM|nr:glutathione transferase GstA [Legionella bononiensis]MBL7479386.1 glutathione transferase GstA [Legionella bononiensis]MBL7527740.1 glutathione transferase GstA [Legionella bononiensis]MBL7563577.1 glutathione transferase GstA [Legionella bononiensis]
MKLYYYKGACSLVVRIIMNEMGLEFQDEEVDLRTKKTASGENFLTINSKGAVPVLGLDNGDVITENQVILQYLTDITPGQELLAPVGDFKRYHTLEWLNYVSTELHKTLGMFFVPMVTEEFKSKVLIPMAMYKLGHVEKHLSHNTYLMGDHYTLPDAYLFVILMWANSFKLDFSGFPHLTKYMEYIQSRPAVIKSLKQEGF